MFLVNNNHIFPTLSSWMDREWKSAPFTSALKHLKGAYRKKEKKSALVWLFIHDPDLIHTK